MLEICLTSLLLKLLGFPFVFMLFSTKQKIAGPLRRDKPAAFLFTIREVSYPAIGGPSSYAAGGPEGVVLYTVTAPDSCINVSVSPSIEY